jgi:hypothetical protein
MKFEWNPVRFRVTGNDLQGFFQGLITNNIKNIDGQLESFILTRQGKIKHQINIIDNGDCYIVECSNDQGDLASFLKLYAPLSKVTVESESIDKDQFNKEYFLKLLEQGKIDTNFLTQSSLYPAEVNEDLVDYKKGCYVGQEVVARMHYKQKNKKIVKIFREEQLTVTHLPASYKILLKIGNYVIIKKPKEEINEI